jgi:hypothetical protein
MTLRVFAPLIRVNLPEGALAPLIRVNLPEGTLAPLIRVFNPICPRGCVCACF